MLHKKVPEWTKFDTQVEAPAQKMRDFFFYARGSKNKSEKCFTSKPLEIYIRNYFPVHCIYFASSCWSFWCAAWPTSTLQWTSRPCPKATKVKFLGLGNFFMLYIASTLPLHTDRFDVLHDLLWLYYTLHDHVWGHQDQVVGLGPLIEVLDAFKGLHMHLISQVYSRTSLLRATA